MAGPLGVTHLLLFSRSDTGNTNLRLAINPRGPTLNFRVERYSLCKDIRRAMKHPKFSGQEFLSPPLLVMNNFMSPAPADGQERSVPKHLEELTTSVFQSLFPAISPQATPLTSIRRVLLVNRELPDPKSLEKEEGSYILNVRHYAITTKRTGLPRSIRRINAAEKMLNPKTQKRAGLPNLSKLGDVADYILDPSAAAGGFTSGSESEAETDAEVEVLETTARKVLNRKQMAAQREREANGEISKNDSRVEKRAVKLVEIGPRMKLRLMKVEEGLCGGKVLWHEFIKKTKQEEKEMEATWDHKRKEKEERKRIQKENVERKRRENGGKDVNGEDQDEDEIMDSEWDSELYDDKDEGDNEDMDVDDTLEVPAG